MSSDKEKKKKGLKKTASGDKKKLTARISAFETGDANNSGSSLGYLHTPTKTQKPSVRGKIAKNNIKAFEDGDVWQNSSGSIDYMLSPRVEKDLMILEHRKGSVSVIVSEFNSVEEANAAAMKLLQEKLARRKEYRRNRKKKKKKKEEDKKREEEIQKKKEKKKKKKKKYKSNAVTGEVKSVWRNVHAKPGMEVDPKTYKAPKYKQDKDQRDLIMKAIDDNIILGGMTTSKAKNALVDAFEPVEVNAGEVLMAPKDKEVDNSYFYIVQEGNVDVKVNDKVVDTVEAGNTFGELNLLYDQDAMPSSDSGGNLAGDGGGGGGGGKKTAGTSIVVPDRAKSVKVLRLNQKSYRGIVQAQTKAEEADKLDLVEKNPMLKSMIPKNDKRNNNATAKKLTSIMKPIKIEKDKVLVDNEKVGDTFFVVQDGHIRVTTAANQAATYGPGDCFGKRALGTNTNEPTEVRITGLDNGNVYSIDKKTLDKVLGENHLAKTKAKAQDTKKLGGFQCIKKVNLDQDSLEQLANKIEDEKFESGKQLLEQGTQTKPALYLVREGSVTLSTDDGRFKQEIKAGGYFGVEQLLAPSNNSNRTPSIDKNTTLPAQWNVTVNKDKPCVLGVLPLLECQAVLDKKEGVAGEKTKKKTSTKKPKEPKAITKTATSTVSKSTGVKSKKTPTKLPPAVPEDRVSDDEDMPVVSDDDSDSDEEISPIMRQRQLMHTALQGKVGLDDLERLTVLGEGEFGEVWLVQCNVLDKKEKFALKIQSTEEGNPDIEELIRREIKVTKTLQHPFIVDLVHTYERDYNVYMLMGLVTGGELWDRVHIEDEYGNWSSGLAEQDAKFYALLIADTLAFMHDKNFLYRDLKPENVMIDADGYPVIVDFGFAKQTKDKTYTFCGTPNYVSPEIVQNVGHHVGADHWALGVLVYEMVSGEHPFYYDGMDQVTLFECIVEEKHYAIQTEVSKDVVEMVDGLLEKEPAERLGMLAGGSKDIIQHSWFKGMDLAKLRKKLVKAPWVPPK